ncbi:hypothetical protein POVWA2_028810 [Plasmodium ovale wallikeri]|uniref:Uncharacterized protein n=1 Tax=Plasmodium ovale wallikeri TaxID=864142 RepID=A0A1A8YXA0_PLAOA|nr:hypothetical protein POVWA1_028970 [Plasmodium ovale wallikeri]SBT36162.1 hypothetical protein POVWA2_028810 [Plasmodium ovale wallikeri]
MKRPGHIHEVPSWNTCKGWKNSLGKRNNSPLFRYRSCIQTQAFVGACTSVLAHVNICHGEIPKMGKEECQNGQAKHSKL